MATAGEVADGVLSALAVTNALRNLTVEETKMLVFQLGVPLRDLDDIDAHHNRDMAKAHYVQKWLDMDPAASWERLVAALRRIGMDSLAADIERSHAPRPANSISDTTSSASTSIKPAASPAEGASYDHKMTILLCGDKGVGKTCLISQLKERYLDPDASPTVGLELEEHEINLDGKRIKMLIWDTPGDHKKMSMITGHFKEAQGILVVYDITDKKSFENVAMRMNSIKRNTVHIVLVGNKIDLENERVVSMEKGEELAKEFGVRLFETSAKNGEGVEEPFRYLLLQQFEKLIENLKDMSIAGGH